MKSFEDVTEFHGHVCPGLAMGYRVAQCALRELGNRANDEELVAVVENNSCAVDAVQVMTGCTFGKGNLLFLDYGKQVYTFIRRPSGQAVRIAIDFTPPQESPETADAWQRYSSGERSADLSRIIHERKALRTAAILNAPDDALMSVTHIEIHQPETARIYPSIACEQCGEKTMEPRIRLRNGRKLCIPCFEGVS